ncbi:MAG: chaperonin [Tepidanaerobacter acetatoxydans]|uniref:TCP-1/cpn60 chaperonin family protein n=1 Tax=Tepidanaerobacter acetatoxydans TaxID=499229 RepID=UPI0026EE0AB0|nr:TCP-1/cpn60 chaperonin family protein [Tepidanaerobacter acetatoxydans]NLU10533.1 chaperonin [Tepidanaerobacter acetatoxydans]
MSFQDNTQEVDEKLAALITNSNAIRAVASAVEGTIGPKGLDIMLVDRFGEVTITNDGVTILKQMDVNHPAAKILINIAKAQQEEVGDGTTTATIMAGAMVSEGVGQILRGVPVAKVIEGIKIGIKTAQETLESNAIPITGIDDINLKNIALIAGRENEDIAELVTKAAKLVGEEKLKDKNFKLKDIIMARAGAENEVFLGLIIDKEKLNSQMPQEISDVRVLLIDDALEPEEIAPEALRTEAGFARYLAMKEEFKENLKKIVDLNVNLVLVDKGINDEAEEILTDAGIIALERVSRKDMEKVAEHTGARIIKRLGLNKPVEEIRSYIGQAEKVYEDEKSKQLRIVGGKGNPMATVMVGAATEEIAGERERIAKDAASSLQAAILYGIVPGGGSIEIAMSRELEKQRAKIKGMAAYGLDCVILALKKPLAQIVYNSGYNPLEKVEEVIYTQTEKCINSIGINCENGEVADMVELGVLDPARVKSYALKAAGEVSEAILRINTIIKKRDDASAAQKATQESPIATGEMDF